MEPEEKTLDDFKIKDGDFVVVMVQKVSKFDSLVTFRLNPPPASRKRSRRRTCQSPD